MQRAVLARELTGEVDLLIVSNPCFGLDFSAVAEIRARIMKARNGGAAVLLMSEDLDELLELSDRILVMSDGALVYETPIATARRADHRRAHGGAPLMADIAAQPFAFRLRARRRSRWSSSTCSATSPSPAASAQASATTSAASQAIVPTVKRLIEGFRAAGLPVIHTMECHRPDLSDCRRPSATAATRRSASATRGRWAAC